jgi:radical SAM protein with 4Fe4S-binding SPASM domain
MGWMKSHEALQKLPELLLRGRLSYDFDGIPLIAERLPFAKRKNLIGLGIDTALRSERMHALPPIIQVEPTNLCNLTCPLCPTGSNSLKRAKGFMSFKTFQKILDELDHILIAVYLFCFGEPFMNRELLEMIRACTDRNILTLTSTNGHFIQTTDEALKVIDSGLTTIIIAVDGSTQDIYQAYRKGGDIERVKRCIANIEEAKVRRGSLFPYTVFRSVITRQNQDDLPQLATLASDLGVNMFAYKSLGCLTHNDEFREYEPYGSNTQRFEYAGSSRVSRELITCPFAFRQPIVFCDGTVVGCEYDHDKDMSFGNIREQTFSQIWNSRNAVKLRRSIIKGTDRPHFCGRCPYQDRVQNGTGLYSKEIRTLHMDPQDIS